MINHKAVNGGLPPRSTMINPYSGSIREAIQDSKWWWYIPLVWLYLTVAVFPKWVFKDRQLYIDGGRFWLVLLLCPINAAALFGIIYLILYLF